MKQIASFGLRRSLRADLEVACRLRGRQPATQFSLWAGIISPRFLPVLLCRIAHKFHIINLGPIAKLISLLNFFLFGIEIAVRCPIGPGLFLPHTQGTVIGAKSIGANVTIYQGVTLGAREIDFSYGDDDRPIIGNNVVIGSGAKVIGGLMVGDMARIGANAVVLESVPANALAIGVPAKISLAKKS